MNGIMNTFYNVLGTGVVGSGLQLSSAGGLSLAVSNGWMTNQNAVYLISIANYTMSPNVTEWIWISELGVVVPTLTYVNPGGNSVCLGQVTTSGAAITSINDNGRVQITPVASGQQTGGMSTIATTGGTTALTNQQWINRVIKFTGALASNAIIQVPPNTGSEWTIDNQTSGAYTLTFQTLAGTGVAVGQGKRCKLYCDGTNIVRVTPDT